MKNEKLEDLKEYTIDEFAKEFGVDMEALRIKSKIIDKIKTHCKTKKISQRKLAKLVPGLTQDRVSKIFNGRVAGMTIDKLIQILTALNIKAEIKFKKAA